MSSNNTCTCSLNITKNADGTCLPTNIINTIALSEGINTSRSKSEKIKKLSEKYNCKEKNEELCILSNAKIDNTVKIKLDQEYFKPYANSLDVNYWMTNSEIDSCMRQFQLTYKNFAYSFIHMIDLIMFPPENKIVLPYTIYQITDIDFGQEFIKSDKLKTEEPLKYYGVIFNTDSSKGSGQHWFSIFISYNEEEDNYAIELFNSSGDDIDSDIFNSFWIKTALDIEKKTGKRCSFFKVSNIQHQSDSTGSCGAYSLFYIYARLNGIPSSDFDNKKRIITDKEMTSFRKFLFRDEIPIS